MILCLPACDIGAGSFCANGMDSTSSSTHVGCISILKGYAVEHGRAVGDRQNLVYLMILCSDTKAAADQQVGGGVEGNPMSKPFIYYTWKTTNGTARVSIDWNTRSDIISIGSQEFERAKGNAFFIERKSDGKLIAKQCGTLDSSASFPEIAKQIRENLPNDELIKSAKFRGVDQ